MTCKPSERRITVELPNAGVEIAPHGVDFRREHGKFDYFKANFNSDVGNHIQDAVLNDGGELSYTQKAYVKMEGERVYPMVFDPGKVGFGRKLTSVELLDPISDLSKAYSDIKTENTRGKDVLENLFDEYQATVDDPILTNILFPRDIRPENAYVVDYGINTSPSSNTEPIAETEPTLRNLPNDAVRLFEGFKTTVSIGIDYFADIYSKDYTVDYDEVSVLEALLDMIEKMGVDVWTKPASPGSTNLHLCIGKYDTRSIIHDATPEDSNAFKIMDYNVSTMDQPVKTVIVRGRLVNDDNLLSLENQVEALDPDQTTQDYRAHGVAKREDLERGQKITLDVDVPTGSLAELAESRFQTFLQRGTSGDIEVSPTHSGKGVTDYRDVSVGDLLKVHEPLDDQCKEWSQIYDNRFVITGVENNISNGYWSMNFDVVDNIPPEEIPDGELRLFDVNSEEYVDAEDLETGLFSGRDQILDIQDEVE